MNVRLSRRQGSLLLVGSVLALFFLFIGLMARRHQASLPTQPMPLSVDACISYTSDAAETLVPTPVAGEQFFAVEGPVRREPIASDPLALAEPYTLRWRVGIGIGEGNPFYFQWPVPRPGWYLNWQAHPRTDPADPGQLGMEFAPMVRIFDNELRPSLSEIRTIAARYPGLVWLIGNEPDVRWQDDATPEEYACYYHFAHRAIKHADPTAQVAIGGLSQITPLRVEYLNQIWASYQEQFGREMPVDIWNMHVFVLREEAGNWGVGIPPGFDHVPHGVLWDIEDHDNLILVENQVRLMRRWMQQHGQRQKPLYITEYGILMPVEYGFSDYRVIEFMVGSFDLFLHLKDAELGYPPDENRLVQRWVWFSTRDHLYPTGDLFGNEGQALPSMRAMSGYIRANAAE